MFEPSVSNQVGTNMASGIRQSNEAWLNLAMSLLFGGKGKTAGQTTTGSTTTGSTNAAPAGTTNTPVAGSRLGY